MAVRQSILTTVAAVFMVAGQAFGHSFDVAIVAPSAGSVMEDVLAGFRVATRERDGHPNEESDGHLGGLDVYMLPIDAGGDSETVLGQASTADIVLMIEADALMQVVRQDLGKSGPPVVGAGELPGGENWAEADGAASFVARFDAEFGRVATRAAAQGYNAARRIELAVRPQGGVDDAQALANALATSRNGIDW